MSDGETRELAREDNLDSKVNLLTKRYRNGSLTKEKLELAAYCGDEAARIILDWRWGSKPLEFPDAKLDGTIHRISQVTNPFQTWVSNLKRWPGAQGQLVKTLLTLSHMLPIFSIDTFEAQIHNRELKEVRLALYSATKMSGINVNKAIKIGTHYLCKGEPTQKEVYKDLTRWALE